MCEQRRGRVELGILTLKRCNEREREREKKNKGDKAENYQQPRNMITQQIHTQEKKRWERMQRTVSVNAANYRDGIALAPLRPTAPGCAQRRRGSCPRVHHAAARASASPYAHDSARDVTLSA
jgi:hypothetical protein